MAEFSINRVIRGVVIGLPLGFLVLAAAAAAPSIFNPRAALQASPQPDLATTLMAAHQSASSWSSKTRQPDCRGTAQI